MIEIGRGGYAALIGGTVKNDGLIVAPLGKIGLGSGEQVTLDFAGDGFLKVALPTRDSAEGEGALVENAGTLQAEGGQIVMTAATARQAARHAINMSGVAEAKTVGGRSGAIVIGGGDGGKVKVSGKLRASSQTASAGTVKVTGKEIALAGAKIDVSGETGGGSVKIGGDWHGAGALATADTLAQSQTGSAASLKLEYARGQVSDACHDNRLNLRIASSF
ncbi:hypothetical protein ASE36_14790 [Rhizobium sp. Root274]|uniref:hypothetical protein n=1 Tax=unclassified Rhizobium TaxID=2613769 RepID=UPI0007159D6D|nr:MULTISPECIES: hypothetical protein [unclassified Rhizobium]KQW29672.1 hypothetical protein ASC71_14815 [Rhizobium sp. Root1240]KRD29861.1 hypothetical protein ASE36_14790 [Rhizobium sp. Root274]